MAEHAKLVISVDSRQVPKANAELNALDKSAQTVTASMTSLAAAVKTVTLGLAAGFGLSEMAKASDAWTDFHNRLRLVIGDQKALAVASADVYRIAQATSQSLQSTVQVYQRLAQQAENLNLSQRELARLSETVSKAVAFSGSSAESAAAAMMQFGQAMASGVLRGEEFNSVNEQANGVIMALADGLGVAQGQLKGMANEGKLTADVVIKALSNATAFVDEKFNTRVLTISAATVELDNAFTKLVGTLSTSQGVGTGLASVISGLGSVLDGLSENAEVLGKALDVALAMAAGKALAALVGLGAQTIKNIALSQAHAGAELMVARSEQAAAAATLASATAKQGLMTGYVNATAAAVAYDAATKRVVAAEAAATAASVTLTGAMSGLFAVAGRIVGFLGGPVGIIATLALTALAFIDFGDDAEKGMDKAAQATESAAARVRVATRNILSDMNLGNVKTATFDQLAKGAETLEEQLTQAEKHAAQLQAAADSDVPLPGFDAAAVDQAQEKVKSLTAALNQLKAEQNDDRFKSQKWAKEYLDNLRKQSLEIADATDREKALLDMRLRGVDATSEAGKQILAQAEANDKAAAAKEAATKAEQEAAKATKAGASASKQAAKELSDYLAETELATAIALKQAAAYRQGEAAVAQLARQEEIERQVLKLGEQARADVTQRVNEYYDAVERRDLSKQTHELSREVDQLQAQAVATLAGRDALDEYNDAKALAIALSGKNVDAQSAEGQALEDAIRKNREAAQVLEQVSRVDGIMDRLLPETRLLREYTEEQDALNKAIELYPEKAEQYREALRRLGVEYEQNRTESSAWGKWTQDALERVDDAFADMWKGVGDGFGSFADGLKSAFSQLLAELAHMAITRPIIVQIGSALGIGGLAGQSSGLLGSLGGGSGGGSGLLGSLSSAYSLYQSGSGNGLLGSVWSGLKNDGITGAWNGLTGYGSSLFSGLDAAGGQLIGSLGGTSSMTYAPLSWQMSNGSSALGSVASWAGPLAGAFAGYQAGGLGGAAVGGLGAWGGAAAGTAIGTAIGGTLGSVLPGIGTAIGAAIGSWAGGKLFGGSGERFKETYTTSSGYYDNGGYVDTGDLAVFSGRRQFGDAYDSYLSDVNERFTTTLGGLYETFGDGAQVQADIAGRLRRTSGAIAGDLWTNIDGESFHRTARYGEDGKNIAGNLEAFAGDVMGEWLAQAIVASDSLPQYMRDQFTDLAKDKNTTPEQVQEVLSGIIGRFEGVNDVLEMVGLSALDATDAGLRAGDAIVELAGGMEQLQSAVGVYYDQFYSESEKVADTLENIPAMFDDAGVELPSIRAEYRAMVEDIDVTTAAGQSMFATLMSLAGSADAYYDILEAQAAAAEQAAAEAAAALLQSELNYYDLFTAEAQKTEDALAGVRAQFAALSVSLPDTRDGFVQAIEALDLTTESGRSMYETMLGLATSADGYYDILEQRAADAQAAAEEAAAAADQAAAEAAATQQAAIEAYYAAFVDESQQARDSIAGVLEQFREAGIVLPASREQYRALVESIDTGTASGEQLYGTLMSLAGAADSAYASLDTLRESVSAAVDAAVAAGQQAVQDAQQAVMEAYQDEASTLEGVIDTFDRFAESLHDFRESLRDSALEMQSPEQQLSVLRRQFGEIAAAAAAGDQTALSRLPEVGSDLASKALELSASRADYLRELAYLQNAAAAAEGAAGEQVSVAQQQLDALDAQLEQLGLAAEAQQSFADAVLQLLQAQIDADALLSEAEREALAVEMHWLSGTLTPYLGQGGAIVAALSSGFDAIDMNTDGLLDQSELRAALVDTGLLSEADLPALSAMFDANGDSVISALEAQDAKLDAHVLTISRSFAALDTSVDGLLDREELKAALVDTGLLTNEQFSVLFEALDDNRDGVVSAIEAASGATAAAAKLLLTGFGTLDASLDGLLDADELKSALVDTGLMTDIDLERLIKVMDTNNDGVIGKFEAVNAAQYGVGGIITAVLNSQFDRMDGNLDGLLDQAELKAALVDTGLLTGEEFGALFAALDDNRDGVVSAVEASDASIKALSGMLSSGLNAVDTSLDGLLDQSELKAALVDTGLLTGAELDALIDVIDTNGDGLIDAIEQGNLALIAEFGGYADDVNAAYREVLGRDAEATGLEYWTALLESGAISTDDIIQSIMTSARGSDQALAAEYAKSVVDSTYQKVVGRSADEGGLDYWSAALRSGSVTTDTLDEAIATSAVNGQAGSDRDAAKGYIDGIIEAAYQSVLGREPDTAGEASWASLLGAGQIQFEDFPGVLASSAFGGPDGADKTAAARYMGIPGYASGGDFSGGLRLVGERGPELEVTGPSRIYSAAQTAELLSGGTQTAAAMNGLQQAVAGLQDGIRSIAKHTMQTAKRVEFLERWEYDGLPETRTA